MQNEGSPAIHLRRAFAFARLGALAVPRAVEVGEAEPVARRAVFIRGGALRAVVAAESGLAAAKPRLRVALALRRVAQRVHAELVARRVVVPEQPNPYNGTRKRRSRGTRKRLLRRSPYIDGLG